MGADKKFIQRVWSIALTLCFLLVIATTFLDYGITWDEPVQATYGELVYNYFQSGFSDTSSNSFLNTKYYGPLFELVSAATYKVTAEYKFEIRHFVISLTALLTIIGVMRFARLFSDSIIIFLAPLALLLMPRFYGHAFNNSKDIPFACAFVWAMYAITLYCHQQRLTWRHTVFSGLCIGTALAIRPGGLLLFFYMAIIAAIFYLGNRNRLSGSKENLSLSVLELFKHIFILVILAWLVMIAPWPWAHENPFLNPVRAFLIQNSFHVAYPFLFEGGVVMSDQLPWYYLPKFILITTPPFLLLLFLAGALGTIYEQYKDFHSSDSLLYFVVQLWFFFPLAYIMIKTPNIYDGIRHFLFILPAMALMIAIGASVLLKMASVLEKFFVYGFLLVAALFSIWELTVLHPYQMTYFNFMVGGLKKAWKSYETDYWTSSYKEAMEWINERSHGSEKPIVVLVAANDFNRMCAEYYMAPNIKSRIFLGQASDAYLAPTYDYYISTTRYGMHRNFPNSPVVHTVGRDGAIFTVIKGRAI
ncbi:ArnT family glycosyltransferase [Thermodesulfobacteriota bacterium]